MRQLYFGSDERISKFKSILVSWIGTPYMHMGNLKKRGVDCTLFVGQCGLEMEMYDKIDFSYYPKDWHIHTTREYVLEGLEGNRKNLKRGIIFKEISLDEELKFGDLIVFSISPTGVSNHSAIYLGDGTFISALNDEGVCIKPLSNSWAKIIKHVFRFYEDKSESGVAALPLLFGAALAGGAALLGAATMWIMLAFTVGAMLASFLFPPGAKQNNLNMKPASLADFQITQANENQPIPLTYGTVKIPGNIVYYGHLQVEDVKQKVSGGKGGGGSQEQTVGYNYYLDIWQVIGLGKLSILKTYINDNEKAVVASGSTFNDGTSDVTPAIAFTTVKNSWFGGTIVTSISSDFNLQYATKEKGVSWIYYGKMYTGDINVTFVPTIQFVVRKYLPDTINYANMYGVGGKDYGNNPAAIIYDILTEHCDIPAYKIDMDSFNACANAFYTRLWGLNFTFSSTQQAKEMIPYVLNFVDAALVMDKDNGKLMMRLLDDEENYAYTMETSDFIEFSSAKPFWGELPNDFRGAIVDASKDYTLRIPLAVRNSANIQQNGEARQLAIDLTAFEDQNVAFSRIYKIMKRQSYPSTSISIKTTRKYYMVNEADVVRIINTDYGIDGVFRVTKKVDNGIDKNELDFDLLQIRSFDDVYAVPAIPPIPVIETIQPLTQLKVFELPYNSISKYDPAFWILASKEVGFETNFSVYISSDGTDYSYLTTISSFALAGYLKENYLAGGYEIDDTQGILFTPYFDFIQFSNVSRKDLFMTARVALIGDEPVAFQSYVPEGDMDYRLKGVIRGLGYFKPQNHYAGEKIFVFNVTGLSTVINRTSSFYLKLVPIGISGSGDLSSATAILVTPQMLAKKPYSVVRIKATRVGSAVNIDTLPVLKEHLGASMQAPESYTDEYPINFVGDIVYSLDNSNWIVNGNNANIQITQAGSFTIYVKHRTFGYESPVNSLVIGANDGVYVGNYN